MDIPTAPLPKGMSLQPEAKKKRRRESLSRDSGRGRL